MRISDWCSDVCSSDLDVGVLGRIKLGTDSVAGFRNILVTGCTCENSRGLQMGAIDGGTLEDVTFSDITMRNIVNHPIFVRSEEHTSELQSLMRISYAVFCLKKKNTTTNSFKQATRVQ